MCRFLSVALTLSCCGSAVGQTWLEQGDAGETLATAQVPMGSGPLACIIGTRGPDADMYLIHIPDPAAVFGAKTWPNSLGDTQLWLFDAAGDGVTFNDDSIGNGLLSEITNQFVGAPGDYYLAVSNFDYDPLNASADEIWLDSPFSTERTPDGPGAPGPVASWAGSGGTANVYQIDLSGAVFIGTPPPANSLTTLFADNNSGSPGGGVYFDVTVGADPIEIISLEVNSTAVVGSTIAVEAYTHVGGASTFENSPAGWTLVATGSGSAVGQGIPTPVTLNAPFLLPANTTLGMALTLGPVAGHAYTNGNGANQHYADANVALDLGQANNAIFGPGLFSPRVWNGTITYNVVLPPTILTQPTSIARCTGASATFQVVASGTGTLSYQWQQDGVAIPGATGASFTIASVMLADAGSYDVVVTNNFGTATSNAATLSVCPGPGDMNGDGLVNAADTALFVTALLAG